MYMIYWSLPNHCSEENQKSVQCCTGQLTKEFGPSCGRIKRKDAKYMLAQSETGATYSRHNFSNCVNSPLEMLSRLLWKA